jgi:predicted metalloprotease
VDLDTRSIDPSQIVDRRGGRGGMPRGGLALGGGGLGVLGVIAMLVLNVLGGGGGSGYDVNPRSNGFPSSASGRGDAPLRGGSTDNETRFVTEVVNLVQSSWDTQFREAGRTYQPTELVLFTAQTRSGCGIASASTGPFYCPADRRVYLDLSFFSQLRSRLGAPGDFAQAYVIAHEFGHHVQTLLGIDSQVRRAQEERPSQRNELSVRLELQADCFAGVWAHSAFEEGRLESGDLEEGLAAAAAVGDDRLQRQATGYVDPESFTHGTSQQRQEWFNTGYQSGSPNSCDTFGGND